MSSTLISQIINTILRFIVRNVLISTVGIVYLGYNAVFTNVLSMLNLAELGVSVAILSFLYKPIVEDDKDQITALMYIYKVIYRYIAGIIFVIGIVVSFLLPYIMKDVNHEWNYIKLLYYLNLVGTVSTYLFSYKASILNADQRSYILKWLAIVAEVIASIFQIIALLKYSNFTIYLTINIVKIISTNILIAIIANKNYPYINKKPNHSIVKEYIPKVKEYVKDVFIAKIGAYIYNGTDNVIISAFVGVVSLGYYSNYTMISIMVQTTILQLLNAVQSTYANIIHSSRSKIDNERKFLNYLFISYLIGNFCFVALSVLLEPFIIMWLSLDMLIAGYIPLLLGINVLLNTLLQIPGQTFAIYGLFKYDKKIVMISVIINIVVSIYLVRIIGIEGVLIGTVLTSLIYLFSRIAIIYKIVYGQSMYKLVLKMAYWFIVSIVSYLIALRISNLSVSNGWVSFVMKVFSTSIIGIFVPLILTIGTVEMSNLIKMVFGKKDNG